MHFVHIYYNYKPSFINIVRFRHTCVNSKKMSMFCNQRVYINDNMTGTSVIITYDIILEYIGILYLNFL